MTDHVIPPLLLMGLRENANILWYVVTGIDIAKRCGEEVLSDFLEAYSSARTGGTFFFPSDFW